MTETNQPLSARSQITIEAGASMVIVLAMLIMFGPLSMDMYLPILPALADDLQTTTSAAQLTMTACLIGLAIGQFVAGPICDRFGRRRPLLIGVVAFVAASALCAGSNSITMLIVWRFIQGLAGGAGLVIAQAAGRDVYEGIRLIRFYGRIIVLSGLAAIIAPVIGGQLASVLDWRGFFWVLAAIGLVILAAILILFPETLGPALRIQGGLDQIGRDVAHLCRDRGYVGAALMSSFTAAAYFAYLGGASFVLQDIYDLTPSEFSIVFALNAAGFALFGFLAGRLAEKWTHEQVFLDGLAILAAGAGLFLIAAFFNLSLLVVIIALFAIAAGAAAVSPPSTAMALTGYPQMAGTAASVLGAARFSAGGIAAPLAGIGGSDTMVPMALVCLSCSGCAYLVFRWAAVHPSNGDAELVAG